MFGPHQCLEATPGFMLGMPWQRWGLHLGLLHAKLAPLNHWAISTALWWLYKIPSLTWCPACTPSMILVGLLFELHNSALFDPQCCSALGCNTSAQMCEHCGQGVWPLARTCVRTTATLSEHCLQNICASTKEFDPHLTCMQALRPKEFKPRWTQAEKLKAQALQPDTTAKNVRAP